MYCIGIAGGTGSGKSSLAAALAHRLGERALLIEHDWYYRDLAHLSLEAREKQNFDAPEALESELLAGHLACLQKGQAIAAPQYDFAQHNRAAATLRLAPRPVVIVEGVLALSVPALLDRYDLRVFVKTPPDLRLIRRLRRDLAERGRTIENVLAQWENHVRPMHEAHVEPAQACADLVVSGEGPWDVALEDILSFLPPSQACVPPRLSPQ